MNYDMAQEGIVALVLSEYDVDKRSFREIGLYQQSEN